MGKAVSITLKHAIQEAVGPVQLCASYESGCEAAVHAMNELFSLPHYDAVIQVDACIYSSKTQRGESTIIRDRTRKCFQLAKPPGSTQKYYPSLPFTCKHSHQLLLAI